MNNFSLTLAVVSLVLLCTGNSYAEPKYMGVATCSSSNCHGSVSKRNSSNIFHNEYSTWFKFSAHSQAYRVLTTDESKKIAAHLGIDKPEESDLCLDCHATNVDEKLRGAKFRISDGVSCESCHGAAENYIKSHTSRKSTHADNVTKGLTDLDSLEVRSNLCLSCHHGTKDKTVDHKLIGAGHPRLTFELDTFGMLQPNHWQSDRDYAERKTNYIPAKAWLVGQATRSIHLLDVLVSKERSSAGFMPELSIFNCYSCHHSLKNDEWKLHSYNGRPGELRLNFSSPQILSIALEEIDSTLAKSISFEIAESQRLLYHGNIRASATRLKTSVEKALKKIQATDFNNNLSRKLLKRVAEYAAESNHLSFETAEQCVMAVAALLEQLKAKDSHVAAQIELLYEALSDEENFHPVKYRKASHAFLKFIEKRFDD